MNNLGLGFLSFLSLCCLSVRCSWTSRQDGGVREQKDEDRRRPWGSPVAEPIFRNAEYVGTITLLPSRSVLMISVRTGEHKEDRSIDLRCALGSTFQPTTFKITGERTVVVGGFSEEDEACILFEFEWTDLARTEDTPRKVPVLYQGTSFSWPASIGVVPHTDRDLVVLDGVRKAVWAWERSKGAIHLLADSERAPGLSSARFLRTQALPDVSKEKAARGYVVIASSASPEEENVPVLSKPSFVYLYDEEGDYMIDEIRGFPR